MKNWSCCLPLLIPYFEVKSDPWKGTSSGLQSAKVHSTLAKREQTEIETEWAVRGAAVASCDTRPIRASDMEIETVTRTVNGSLIKTTLAAAADAVGDCAWDAMPDMFTMHQQTQHTAHLFSPSIHPSTGSVLSLSLSLTHSLIRLLPETVLRFLALLRHFDIYNSRAFESRSNGFSSNKRVSLPADTQVAQRLACSCWHKLIFSAL